MLQLTEMFRLRFEKNNIFGTFYEFINLEEVISLNIHKGFDILPIDFYMANSMKSSVTKPNSLHDKKESITPVDFRTFFFKDSRSINEVCFSQFLEELQWQIFRIKGPIRFPDRFEFLN